MASNNSIVQEMICTAMQRLSSGKQGDAPITKGQILEVLFQAKEILPGGNPVKSHLAYYWYVDGPYSENICSNIDNLVDMGVITYHKTAKYEAYKLASAHARTPIVPHDDHVDRAAEAVSQTARTFANIGAIVDEIYAKAPFRWYAAYRRNFQPKFESYAEATLGDRECKYTRDDISNCLDDAVLEYPTPPKFMEHRRIFMDFSKMLNSLLYSSESSIDVRKEMLCTLLNLAERIWEVFAEGVRISHHDGYYDGRAKQWKDAYKSSIDTLDSDIMCYAKKFESVRDDRRLAPEIEDMILHPEKYEFKPYVVNAESRANL